ncbi:MAG: esterase-like activity of phytase family protein, partial [Bacteroidota bacterium]
TIVITGVTTLLSPEGKPYSDNRVDPTHSLDGEALRYNQSADEIIYSAEGERTVNKGKEFLVQNPTVYSAYIDGSFKDSFELPPNLYFHETENGPRTNSVFEGLTFTEDYRYLYLSVEEPIYEDGPRAGTGDSTAWVRFLKFDTQTRKQVAQYAYKIEALPYPANPPGAAKINGVSDILYAGNNKFIVIERAYMTGRNSNYVQVFLADVNDASDISAVGSIQSLNSFHPITKKLLINMESLNRHIDNIEGVTFGPLLSNGHQTMLFVVDDNFSPTQTAQLFLFEVIP